MSRCHRVHGGIIPRDVVMATAAHYGYTSVHSTNAIDCALNACKPMLRIPKRKQRTWALQLPLPKGVRYARYTFAKSWKTWFRLVHKWFEVPPLQVLHVISTSDVDSVENVDIVSVTALSDSEDSQDGKERAVCVKKKISNNLMQNWKNDS